MALLSILERLSIHFSFLAYSQVRMHWIQVTGKRVVEIINTKLLYFFRSVLGVEKLSGSCAVMAVIEERRRVWQLLLISTVLFGRNNSLHVHWSPRYN